MVWIIVEMCLHPSCVSDTLGTPGKAQGESCLQEQRSAVRGVKHGQSCNKGRPREMRIMGPPGVEREAEESPLGRNVWGRPPRRWMERSGIEATLDK